MFSGTSKSPKFTKAEEGLPTSDFPLPTSDFQLPTSNFRLPTSDFQLPTSDFRLPTSVAMKGGDRPTRLLPYAKMLLVPKTFFSLLLGRLCSRRFWFWLSRLFHIERSWHTYRFTVVFVSGRQDLPSDSRAYSLKIFITAEPKGFNFLQSAFWT